MLLFDWIIPGIVEYSAGGISKLTKGEPGSLASRIFSFVCENLGGGRGHCARNT